MPRPVVVAPFKPPPAAYHTRVTCPGCGGHFPLHYLFCHWTYECLRGSGPPEQEPDAAAAKRPDPMPHVPPELIATLDTPEQQQAATLSNQGMSHRDIARVMGNSAKNVGKLLRKVREKLPGAQGGSAPIDPYNRRQGGNGPPPLSPSP